MGKQARKLKISLQERLYNLAMHIYWLAIKLAAYRNHKARQFINGRKGLFDELKINVVTNEHYIWFHCASLGEFEQARPLIEKIRHHLPHARLVITFFSPSGYEMKKDYEGVDEIYYLPIDTPANAEEFVNLLKPKLAIFIKYDFWYNHLKALHKAGIPTLLVSGRFRRDQLFFKSYASLSRNLLGFYDHFFVQDQDSQHLLKALGINNSTLIPDTRIDRVVSLVRRSGDLRLVNAFSNNRLVIIGGSTYEEEENWLLQWRNQLNNPPKMIIAPHEPTESRVRELLQQFGKGSERYKNLNDQYQAQDLQVLIIDQVGLLGELYQYGDLALIGGGFRKSIHNILEPAAHGLPLLFGPRHHKFPEGAALIEEGGAASVSVYADFQAKANQWLDHDKRALASKSCQRFINRNTGGTEKVYRYIIDELDIPAFRQVPNPEYLQ